MTIVAAAFDGTEVVIGSDTQSTGTVKADFGDKIVQVADLVCAGHAGSWSESAWLRRALRHKLSGLDITNWSVFIDILEDAWDEWYRNRRDRGHGKTDECGSTSLPGHVLLATPGALILLDDDGSVLQSRDDQFAIGSGTSVAMGAMYALRDRSPTERVRAGLQAAIRYAEGCGGTISMYRLGPEGFEQDPADVE